MGRRRKGRRVNGILLVDKPEGISSNAVLQRIKRLFHAQKAGHTGALDPLATGMLPICLGEATKFSQYSLDADKAYQTCALLGVRTDTSDADGEVVEEKPVKSSEQDILEALTSYTGDLLQTPSPYSALKYEGKPLYYYARKGVDVPRPTRQISVYHNELISIKENTIELEIHCSKGTYIRTIVDDLGQSLGCGAHVAKLRRLWISGFKSQKMHTLESLEQHADSNVMLDSLLLPMDVHLSHIPIVRLDDNESERFQHGMQILKAISVEDDKNVYRIYAQTDNRFLGLAEINEKGELQPKRVVVYEE